MYNVATNLILQVVVIIYGLIVPKLIITNYGSEVNGLISSISQFLGYITLLEAGFGPVVKSVLYKPIAKNNKKEIANILKTSERFFRKIALIFIIYIIGLSLLYPLIMNNQFDYLYTVSLILIISISTFVEYFFGMTYSLFLQSKQRNYVISVIQAVTYIICITIILILVKFNVSIHTIKLASAIIFVLRPICQKIYFDKKFSINLKTADDNYSIKNKWDGLVQHIAWVIHNNTDVVVLTFFCSLAEISVYSVYLLIVRGIKSIIQAFSSGIDSIFGDMLVKNESNNLNEKFGIYETIYFLVTTIIFSCTLVLIVPFVQVYTKNITDVNYIRYTFGSLLVISEYVWAIRLPYSSIILSAGHFKETRKGAWVETLTNIIISLLLVKKFGIIGVAIGTIVAMLIRTIEFVYHANKYILKRNIGVSIKKLILTLIITILIVFLSKYIPMNNNTTYLNWILNSIMILLEASFIGIIINSVFYRKDYKKILEILKNNIKRKKA